MSRGRPILQCLLVAAIIARVIAGGGHIHTHVADDLHSHFGIAGEPHHHHATDGHYHAHGPHAPQHLPSEPADEENCSVCRYLALAAILAIDLEVLATGDVVECAADRKTHFFSSEALGLHRPRSPPELS